MLNRRLPISKLIVLSTILGSVSFLTGCGGGGGGGDSFIGAAEVRVTVSPNKIDTGDRSQVRVTIREVHENGIALKVRYPVGLEYVRDSAILQVGSSKIDSGPLNNVAPGDEVYLVFYFSPDLFKKSNEGELYFELEATSEVVDGQIEVDADVDDPDVDNDDEFDATLPEFLSESSASIAVVD